jgi:hypothetical protein
VPVSRNASIQAVLAAVVCAASPAAGQPGLVWQRPPEEFKLDFAAAEFGARAALRDAGLQYEQELVFALYGRDRVTLVAHLPEDGLFEVRLKEPSRLIQVRPQTTSGPTQRVEIGLSVKPQSLEQLQQRAQDAIRQALREPREKARQEADKSKPRDWEAYLRQHRLPIPDDGSEEKSNWRQAYEMARGVELGEAEVRELLQQVATRRASWLGPQDTADWEKASPHALLPPLVQLLTLDLACECLQGFGLKVEATRQNYDTLIRAKVAGVCAAMSGDTGSGAETKGPVRALAPEDVLRLRQSIVVQAVCCFRPGADPADGNAQWFQGQRIYCLGRGIAGVRVEGRLDPARHDRVDWWTLPDYSPDSVRLELPAGPGVRCELFSDAGQQPQLRVWATGASAVSYALQFEPRTPGGGQQVVIYETPSLTDVKFPY